MIDVDRNEIDILTALKTLTTIVKVNELNDLSKLAGSMIIYIFLYLQQRVWAWESNGK